MRARTAGFLVPGHDDHPMKPVRVVAALLLCLALLAGGAAAASADPQGQMTVVSGNDTAEYLAPEPGEIDRSGAGSADIDVAGAVGSNAGEVRATYRRVTLEQRLRAADSDEERREVIRAGTDRLGARVDELQGRHDAAVERYAAGTADEDRLFRTLSVVNREAERSAETAEWLERQARGLGMDETATRLSEQRIRLLSLRGPVRSAIDEGHKGGGDVRAHVVASDGGLVLATVERDLTETTYVREAYDAGVRSVDSPDQYDGIAPDAFEERIEELYPWVRDNSRSASLGGAIGTNDARIYIFEFEHAHGDLATYLDGGTDEIVREIQEVDPELVPTTTVNATSETTDLRLRVETTRGGGPLGVTVIDDATGEAVDAAVQVNGEGVGSTGDGRLWTVAPRGELRVNATRAGETLTVETTVE